MYRGDVVFTHAGNIGQAAYIPDDSRFDRYVISQRQFYMRCNRLRVIPEFVAYYFRSPEGQHNLLANASQTGVPSIAQPVSYLRTVRIPVPSLPEQRAIAGILGALDDKIELNRRMNQTLEAMAQAIFKSWFVDFEPFRDQGMQDSPMGPIPKGWEIAALGDVVSLHDSKRIPLSSRERQEMQGPYPYYGATGIMDHVNDYLFDGVYALIAEDGSVIDDSDHPVTQYVWGQFWVNNHAHVLQGSQRMNTEHLLLLLRQVNIYPYITGAVQPKLSQQNLRRIPLVLPPPDVCGAFAEHTEPMFAGLRTNVDQSKALVYVRDTLLPKLLSGEVRVKDAEEFVGEAT